MHALGFVVEISTHQLDHQRHSGALPQAQADLGGSGLAWVPFLMQRLDDQYLMRPSEAPQLRRLPSEYMREPFLYTTQPMETTNSRRWK